MRRADGWVVTYALDLESVEQMAGVEGCWFSRVYNYPCTDAQ